MPAVELRIPPQDDPPAFGRYMPGLDGLRGIAILAVMMLHYSFWYLEALPATRLGRYYLKIANNGWRGVDLFFVLSGFLITGILLDSKGSSRYFRNFYARRTLRIFPLYYGVLVVVFLLLPHTPWRPAVYATGSAHQAWLWLYGTNFEVYKFGWAVPDPAPLIVTHFWSLAVEEHFYLVWPLVVYLFPNRGLVAISLALVCSALVCNYWVAVHHMRPTAYLLTPCRTNTLALGGLLALAVRTHRPRNILSVLRSLMICAAAIAVARRISPGPWRMILGTALQQGAMPGFFCWLIAESALPGGFSLFKRPLANSPLTMVGRYSYGIYVIHQLINQVIHQAIGTRLPHMGALPETVLYFLIAGTITFAAAFASFHGYEKWFLRLKRYFPVEPAGRVKSIGTLPLVSNASAAAQLGHAG